MCNIYNCFGKSPKVCRWQLRIQNQQRRTDGGYQTANRVRKLEKRHREVHGNPVWTASPSLEAVFFLPPMWPLNNRHTNCASKGGGQLWLCTAGKGWYREEGKAAVSLHEGSVIMISASVRHWRSEKGQSVQPYRHRGSRWKLSERMVWSGVRGRIYKAARNTLRITVNASAFRIGA